MTNVTAREGKYNQDTTNWLKRTEDEEDRVKQEYSHADWDCSSEDS